MARRWSNNFSPRWDEFETLEEAFIDAFSYEEIVNMDAAKVYRMLPVAEKPKKINKSTIPTFTVV